MKLLNTFLIITTLVIASSTMISSDAEASCRDYYNNETFEWHWDTMRDPFPSSGGYQNNNECCELDLACYCGTNKATWENTIINEQTGACEAKPAQYNPLTDSTRQREIKQFIDNFEQAVEFSERNPYSYYKQDPNDPPRTIARVEEYLEELRDENQTDHIERLEALLERFEFAVSEGEAEYLQKEAENDQLNQDHTSALAIDLFESNQITTEQYLAITGELPPSSTPETGSETSSTATVTTSDEPDDDSTSRTRPREMNRASGASSAIDVDFTQKESFFKKVGNFFKKLFRRAK